MYLVDYQAHSPSSERRLSLGELQFEGNINPFSEKPGFDMSVNGLHISDTKQKQDGSQTTKVGVGASFVSAEVGYDDGTGNSGKFGVSLGVGAGLSITEKDSDQDGLDESCVGAEVGPISFELCRENTPHQQALFEEMGKTEDLIDRIEIGTKLLFSYQTEHLRGL